SQVRCETIKTRLGGARERSPAFVALARPVAAGSPCRPRAGVRLWRSRGATWTGVGVVHSAAQGKIFSTGPYTLAMETPTEMGLVEAVHRIGRAGHPAIQLSRARLAALLAGRDFESMGEERVAEVYLACACADGDVAGLAILEAGPLAAAR